MKYQKGTAMLTSRRWVSLSPSQTDLIISALEFWGSHPKKQTPGEQRTFKGWGHMGHILSTLYTLKGIHSSVCLMPSECAFIRGACEVYLAHVREAIQECERTRDVLEEMLGIGPQRDCFEEEGDTQEDP